MRIRWFIFISILVGITCFYAISFLQEVKSKEIEINHLEEKLRPSEYLAGRWTFPSTESQAHNYKKAVSLAKKAYKPNNGLKSGLASDWRMEGPTNIGGRANCLLIDSRDTNTIYAGMAAGGIFKTTNGGTTWLPIADDFAFLSISDMVQDPLHPDTIFAATGDRNFPSIGQIGDGVRVSYDAGNTWQSTGLNNAGVVTNLLIDSTNRILWAAVLGNPRVKNFERGVYRSTDMGASWQNVHLVNDSAGAIDIVIDPFDPQTLYVSYFNRQRTATSSRVSGNDGRIWQTKDGGATWTMLTNGLPNFSVSRIGLDISKQTPGKVYVSVVGSDFNHLGLYRSLDTGRTWTLQPAIGLPPDYTGGFGWYFDQIRVNPFDDDEIWLMGVDMYTSTDGGSSFVQSVPPWFTNEVHADKHDLLFIGPNRFLLATDGGLYKGSGISMDPNNWVDIDLIPNNQFYRIAINPHRANYYAGGVQDNGTLEGTYTEPDQWTRVFGGDGFQIIYDPVDSNIYYYETQNGNLYAFDEGTGFSNFDFDDGVDGGRNWDMPFIMSRFNRNKLYCISDRVFETTQGPYGRFNPVHFGILNTGLYNLSTTRGSALCESKLDSNLLYAGTGDGKVWRIHPTFNTETDISAGLPNRFVTALTTSAIDTDLVIVTHSGYLDFQNTPHIHMSTDRGANWTPIAGDLPPFALNDVEILDNAGDSILFVASDVGVYVSFNRGVNWERVGGNMPMIQVNNVAIDYSANRLIAGTFARSIQSFDLDSIFPLTSLVQFDLGNDTTICPGDTIELGTGLSLANYTWSTGESSPTIKVFNSGIFWLETQTSNGTIRDSINISIENLPSNLDLGNDTSICRGSSLTLGNQIDDFDTYTWNTGSTDKTITINDSGTYILEVQNKCYFLRDTIKVMYHTSQANIESNRIDDSGNFYFRNTSTMLVSSQWFLDTQLISSLDSFRYQFSIPDTYRLILVSTDSNACVTRDSLEIIIEPTDYIIPNIFTPNQDGINDAFFPYGNTIIGYSMIIYNKWGARIIELENIPWSGRDFGGKPMESGIYFFKLKLEFSNGTNSNESGSISLIR